MLGLGLALALWRRPPAAAAQVWILAAGAWDDGGVWVDAAVWVD